MREYEIRIHGGAVEIDIDAHSSRKSTRQVGRFAARRLVQAIDFAVTGTHPAEPFDVTWSLLDPMTGTLVHADPQDTTATVRTDRVDLANARSRGLDDVTAIKRILAIAHLGSLDYANDVVVIRAEKVEA